MPLKTMVIISLLFALAVGIIPAWGADFSTYNNKELASMRGTLRGASAEDCAAFRKEWQNRLQSMTLEERQNYIGRPAKAPADSTGYRANAPEGEYSMNQQRNNAVGGYNNQYRMRRGGGRGRN